MPTIGIDCEIILGSTGYFIRPGSYLMKQPRIRKATIRQDAGEAYVDLGPGKRVWSMIVICKNDLVKYSGASTALTGQQYRDALRTSFTGSTGTTINFTDPLNNSPVAVHFDSYAERIMDLHTQMVGPASGGSVGASYEVTIVLVES